ncbi:hypothetical protein [Alkalihalobacterium bogoriense]|uniref:hypothetical protein n=1 Tax=Alkalihalobacterium bogoriense TaxID=246272 RepID=UPI00047B15C5|nr:hypothetical protein [Alkalihalobacterium bogoriense]
MGLFQSLKKMLTQDTPKQQTPPSTPPSKTTPTKPVMTIEEGMTRLEDAECPYCHANFDKPLTRKKACPECKRDVYVRTLPYTDEKDSVRVAVTEEQVEKIEIAWAKLNGTYEEYVKSKQRYENMKEKLHKQWGKEPSESDIEWHLLMEERIELANERKWGLYRNATLKMAENLYKIPKYDLSLRHYLGVLYIDLNGPNNVMTIDGKPYEDGVDFDPTEPNAFIAPGIIKRIVLLKDKRVPMSHEEVRELFLDEAGQIHTSIRTPLSPEEAWERLKEKEEYWGD